MKKAACLGLPVFLLAAVFAPAPAPASIVANCNYNPGQHTIRIIIEEPVSSFEISVTSTGNIDVGGVPCAEDNAVFNVDKITVIDNAGASVLVTVDLDNPFGPGFTDEPGMSDEIEFKFDLKGGNDRVGVDGHPGPAVSFRAGRTKIAGAKRDVINFNADDRDFDLVLFGVDGIIFYGSSHADILSGRGGLGTGDPYTKRLTVVGGDGDDAVTGGLGRDNLMGDGESCTPCPGEDFILGLGGADKIYGDAGRDRMDGDKGSDELFGGAANDKVEGGEGDDSLFGEDGNDNLIGGKDVDACDGGPGTDTLKNCENNPPS